MYWGQRLSGFVGTMGYVMVDLGRYGIPGGQLQISPQTTRSSWEPFLLNTLSFTRLAYYQSLFDNMIELIVGYMTNDTVFVGSFLGSNLASPFGPVASIPIELGMASPPGVAPTVDVKLNIGASLYNVFGVQRSMPPMGDPFIANAQMNPTGLNFKVDHAKVLLIEEAGYKRMAAPAKPYLWARLGAMYNTSQYTDFSQPGKTATNFGSYLLVDRQVLQLDPSSPATAYRGFYLGASAMYGAPKTNVISQYYEGRAYIIGPFRSRPQDQVGLVYFHQTFSSYLRSSTNAASASTGVSAHASSNTVTLTYTGKLLSGLYATEAVSYTDHPSFTFVEGEGHALLLLASLFVVF